LEAKGDEHIMPDKTILIVDDTPANIAAALAILKDQYRTRVATSGAKALEHAGAADKLARRDDARHGWL
jgi:CheY-like chemotaxis protein